MSELTVLTEGVLRSLVGMGMPELEAVEGVYPLISDGSAVMPPIMRVDVVDNNGEIDIKSAYLPGYPGIAVKVSAGFFDNPSRGLPSLGGFMMVLDSQTGVPTAGLFDNGYLTDLRTGLAGAVAAKHLARPSSSTVALVGAGAQARFQLRALGLVLTFDRVLVWARRPEQANDLVGEMEGNLDCSFSVVRNPGALIEADVIVTTTPATSPILEMDRIGPGTHVTAVGSDAEHKRELGPGVMTGADLVVVDSVAQSVRLGESRSALAEGLDPGSLVELGDIVAGTHPGRTDDTQITVCDLTGTGAQDTAIAGLAVERARSQNVGDVIHT
ncbi:ectoine utilization protein EutC [soil metagenome]